MFKSGDSGAQNADILGEKVGYITIKKTVISSHKGDKKYETKTTIQRSRR